MHWFLVLAEADPSPLAQVDDLQDWTVIGLTILFFVIFLNLMRTLVFTPVFALLDERKAKISQGFTDLEAQRAELTRLQSAYETQLAQIDAAAGERTQAAIDEGKKASQAMLEQARQDYLAAIEAGRESLAAELAASKEKIFQDVANLTFAATEEVLAQPVPRERYAAEVARSVEEALR